MLYKTSPRSDSYENWSDTLDKHILEEVSSKKEKVDQHEDKDTLMGDVGKVLREKFDPRRDQNQTMVSESTKILSDTAHSLALLKHVKVGS